MDRRSFLKSLAASAAAPLLRGQDNLQHNVQFTLAGNSLYYLVDCGLQPPPAIVAAINNGKVEDMRDEAMRGVYYPIKPPVFIHGGANPKMNESTINVIRMRMKSDVPLGDAGFFFFKDNHNPEMPLGKIQVAIESGKYPKWRNAQEYRTFMGNLVDKVPYILRGMPNGEKVGQEVDKRVDEEFRGRDTGLSDEGRKNRSDMCKRALELFMEKVPELRNELMVEVDKVAATMKSPAVAPPGKKRGVQR